ncbi:uncharacterized protein LOC120359444, partial [Solenopsis invicta]|uniref:uncharacterized protein LOC120359444 n=1 Tax=Solenopsis invicta TaxID=13686 RepID=UPI00193CF5AB
HFYKIIEYLIDTLQQSVQSDIVEASCYIIGEMTLFSPAASELANAKSVGTILDLLKKEDLEWSARYAASFAIKRLLMNDIKNCIVFLNIHGPVIL